MPSSRPIEGFRSITRPSGSVASSASSIASNAMPRSIGATRVSSATLAARGAAIPAAIARSRARCSGPPRGVQAGASAMNAYSRFSRKPARSGGDRAISRMVAVQPAPQAGKAATAPAPPPQRWRSAIAPVAASANSVTSDPRR